MFLRQTLGEMMVVRIQLRVANIKLLKDAALEERSQRDVHVGQTPQITDVLMDLDAEYCERLT